MISLAVPNDVDSKQYKDYQAVTTGRGPLLESGVLRRSGWIMYSFSKITKNYKINYHSLFSTNLFLTKYLCFQRPLARLISTFPNSFTDCLGKDFADFYWSIYMTPRISPLLGYYQLGSSHF